MGSIMHYMVHCSRRVALQQIDETLKLFSPFLHDRLVNQESYTKEMVEGILYLDSNRLYRQLFRSQWRRILLRKGKQIFYHIFKKRI